MKEIIIVIGSSRAGKTSYSEKLEKEGYEYIGIDEHYHYGEKEEYLKFVNFISDKLNDNKDKNFVLDGYLDLDIHFNYLRNKLKHHKIKPIIIYAKTDILIDRLVTTRPIRMKDSKEEEISIKDCYTRWVPNSWDINECEFVDSSNGFKKTSYAEMFATFLIEQDVIDFIKKFEERGLEKYQTIELPFDHKIQGYNANYQYESWDRISKIYDFKDKKVADIGCFHGFFCFEIKKIAKIVHGFDFLDSAIETAREIAKLKGMDIKFDVFNMDKEEIKEDYDVILLLNTSQHLKNLELDFNKIFPKTKALILEMGFVQLKPHWSMISKEKLLEIAEKHNFKLTKEVASTRPSRTIMLFENEN